jgi:hypothetical protein
MNDLSLPLYQGLRVQVYRNLRENCFSVRDAKTRKVIAHTKQIWLTNCKMHASRKGVDRIRSRRRKSVVAWIEGTVFTPITEMHRESYNRRLVPLRFNPYETYVWLDSHNFQVNAAEIAYLEMLGHCAWTWVIY